MKVGTLIAHFVYGLFKNNSSHQSTQPSYFHRKHWKKLRIKKSHFAGDKEFFSFDGSICKFGLNSLSDLMLVAIDSCTVNVADTNTDRCFHSLSYLIRLGLESKDKTIDVEQKSCKEYSEKRKV